jgi:hypothetical protein
LVWLLGIPICGFMGAVAGSWLDINGGNGDTIGLITGLAAFLCIRIVYGILLI